MAVPATTGKLCTTIEEMKIGDYIAVSNDSTHGHRLGTNGLSEIPVTGNSDGMGFYYFVKVDKGLLVSDRVTRHSISWDTLNSVRSIEGAVTIYGTTQGLRRSLTGGAAYADEFGNISLSDRGFGGWPTNNEWDKHIVNFPSNKIQSGKTIDDIFHIRRSSASPYTWCQETPVNGLTSNLGAGTANNTYRIMRGLIDTHSETATVSFSPSSINDSIRGFRPVFEYKEV